MSYSLKIRFSSKTDTDRSFKCTNVRRRLIFYISDVCPAGTYLPIDEKYCKSCEGNTISTENATSCVPCAAREFANKDRTKCGIVIFTFRTKLGISLKGQIARFGHLNLANPIKF